MRIKTKALYSGIFTIMTMVIILLLLIFLTNYNRLSKERTFIMRFKGNLKGLHVGADVEYRGIKIGEVYKIEVVIDQKNGTMTMPVWVRLLNRFIIRNQHTKASLNYRLNLLIKRGLRAQLQSGNIITGEQNIALVFKPNSPVKFYYPGKLEIPTITAESKEEMLRKTLVSAQNALNSISVTMKTANVTLKNVNTHIDPIVVQLNNLLITLQKTSYNINVFSEYLSRHPESFIAGKP